MRFLHTADIHLGATPDSGMPWGAERAQDIWNTFRQLIHTAAREQVDLFLIAGDLFHRQPLQKECKEINYLFSTIPNTRVVIIAGNHDYIHEASPYLNYAWEPNVTILSSETPTSVYFPELNTEVHGFSYHRQEIPEPLYDNMTAPEDGRFHILLAHGGDDTHIPLHMNLLTESGFDYIALGHIHQPKMFNKAPIAYCGSPEPMDRTDMGKRGFIMGTLDEEGCRYYWYACATYQYRLITISVDRNTTTSQIVDTLRKTLETDDKSIYRITLNGFRDPIVQFDIPSIMKIGRIVEVNDNTEPEYDLEQLLEDHAHDLISHYIRALSGPDASMLEHKALYYGLRALLDPE